MPRMVDLLTSIRDTRKDILRLKQCAYERYRELSAGRSVSQEELEIAMMEVYEAKIQLAQAELEILKHTQVLDSNIES